MKRERIFYLDFVRAFATIVIVLTHYNALFVYNVNRPEMAIFGLSVSNIYIGSFGVSLFLIISGASLMYVYGPKEHVDWKTFYCKRARTIFPIFWIAYLLVLLCKVVSEGGFFMVAPRYSIIYTLFGFDFYLANFGLQTFALVGEWFLGFILVIYILFPLMLFGIKRFPKITAGVVIVLYALSVWFLRDMPWANSFPLMRLPEIFFGMYFIRYVKRVPIWVALAALAVLIANAILKPGFDQNLQTTYVGICAFLVLVYIARFLDHRPVRQVCAVVCKYSYACFIIHHQVIFFITSKADLQNITKTSSVLLFLACGVAIIFASFFLQKITNAVLALYDSMKKPKLPAEPQAPAS